MLMLDHNGKIFEHPSSVLVSKFIRLPERPLVLTVQDPSVPEKSTKEEFDLAARKLLSKDVITFIISFSWQSSKNVSALPRSPRSTCQRRRRR